MGDSGNAALSKTPSPEVASDDEAIGEEDIKALERWLIREAVRSQVQLYLNPPHTVASQKPRGFRTLLTKHNSTRAVPENSLMGRAMAKLSDFPPFRNDSRMKDAIEDIFRLSPRLDAALKARKGSTTMERFFVSLIASPVISSARLTRRRQGDANTATTSSGRPLQIAVPPEEAEELKTTSSFSIAAAKLFEEILEEEGGVRSLLEELKTVHSVFELRPSVRDVFAGLADSWTVRFMHGVRRKPQEMRDNFHRLPRHAILTALNLNAGSKATSAAVAVLFARPFGVTSFWQRFVAEAVNLTTITAELERVCAFLNDRTRLVLQDSQVELVELLELESTESNEDDANVLRNRRDTIESYLSKKAVVLTSEPEKWAALRFIELTYLKVGLEALVDVVGMDEFRTSLRTILSSSKTRLAESLLAKDSGFVKFVTEVFACFDASLAEAAKTPDNEVLSQFFRQRWDKVQYRGITVIHNVLVNDPDHLLHETLQWLIDLQKSGKNLGLPTWEALTAGLSPEEVTGVEIEAKKARRREIENVKRKIGTPKTPLPKFEYSNRLVGKYIDVFQNEIEAFTPKQSDVSTLIYVAETAAMDEKVDFVTDIEVTWNEQQEAEMKRRGFKTCGNTNSARVWIRNKSRRGNLRCDSRPIVAIQFVGKESKRAQDIDWITIPRNLNKGSFATPSLYIRYKRRPASVVSSKAILDIRFLDSLSEENKRLGAADWVSAGTFKNSMLFDSHVWLRYSEQ